MKIGTPRIEILGERRRVSAPVTWEDSQRRSDDIYFEVPEEFGDGVSTDVHAFLVAAILPAMRHGEKRVALEAPICPELKVGLSAATALIRLWYGEDRRPPRIEAPTHSYVAPFPRPERAAFFFTGGVDSLATLRANRCHFGESHPGYFRDGLLIFGLEVEQIESFEHVMGVLEPLARDAGVAMLPVYTNVRQLDDDWVFWSDEFEAAVLASVAHALGRRLSAASIGSSFDYPYLHPHGSHPLLDANYSSSGVQIRHDGTAMSRLEKTRLLAGWDAALASLRVCNRSEGYQRGLVNCGRCEKCLRTLTALLVVGKLDEAKAFASREVTPELIVSKAVLSKTSHPFWPELVQPLEDVGRSDLAAAVRQVIARYENPGGIRRSLRRFDDAYLNGALRGLKRRILPAGLLGAGWLGA